MTLIADILLIAAALGAGLYCLVLSRRLTRFTTLEDGVGGAVAVLAVQVDEMKAALAEARSAADATAQRLDAASNRAEETVRNLELLMASSHDMSAGRAGSIGTADRSVRRRRRRRDAAAAEDAA